jgi:hypothetical protein
LSFTTNASKRKYTRSPVKIQDQSNKEIAHFAWEVLSNCYVGKIKSASITKEELPEVLPK